MKTLLLLRHAKSSWKDSSLEDHDRPLNKRGKLDAPRMGGLLRKENLVPDAIVSSTAKRARKTAKMAGEECGFAGRLTLSPDLYCGGPSDFVRVLHEVSDDRDRVMVVAHNPGLEEFLEILTDEYERMPTAALAVVKLPIESWRDLRVGTEGKLEKLWLPGEVE
jgi:phosphohistidine phosphatase